MLLGRLWALQVHPLTDRKPTENRQKRVLARCPVSVGFLSVLGFLFVSISAPLGPFGVFWMLLGRLWALQVHPLTDRKPTKTDRNVFLRGVLFLSVFCRFWASFLCQSLRRWALLEFFGCSLGACGRYKYTL